LRIIRTNIFKRDYKKAKKQNKDLGLLKRVLTILVSGEEIPRKFHDHRLTGQMKAYRELHLAPDWLLIYRIDRKNGELLLLRMGSHAELFK